MGVNLASFEAIWLCKILSRLFGLKMDPTTIYHDNQSCIKHSKSLVFHDKSNHIETKYHFIIDRVQKGVVILQYISRDKKVIDIITNPLVMGKFIFYKDKLGVVQNYFLARREC